MPLFGRKDKNQPSPTPVAAAAAPTSTPAPSGQGPIVLTKGSKIVIEKSPVIRARASWSSHTDYDLYALVLTRDGKVHTVSTFGTKDRPNDFQTSVLGGAVRHLGDVGREANGEAQEIIEIALNPEVVAVVPVAYSAQSNGVGSFRQYRVSLAIDNGSGSQVEIRSDHADNNDTVYSVAIGIIRNTPEGVQIEALESYSQPGSERRPALLADGTVKMDAGPINVWK